jgi:hypothetical protein
MIQDPRQERPLMACLASEAEGAFEGFALSSVSCRGFNRLEGYGSIYGPSIVLKEMSIAEYNLARPSSGLAVLRRT